MKHGMETLHGIQYKLRIMGVPIEEPLYIYGYNMLVIHNTQKPGSTMKKKSNSIFYHTMRDIVATVESLTNHIPTGDSFAYLLTKVLYGRKRRYPMINLIYNTNDDHILEHNLGVSYFES